MALPPVAETAARMVVLAVGAPGDEPVPVADDAPLPITIAAIGAVDDAAWSGSGDATVISLLKAIAINTTPA